MATVKTVVIRSAYLFESELIDLRKWSFQLFPFVGFGRARNRLPRWLQWLLGVRNRWGQTERFGGGRRRESRTGRRGDRERLWGGAEGERQVLRGGGGQQFWRFGRSSAWDCLWRCGEGYRGRRRWRLPTGLGEECQGLWVGSQTSGLDHTEVLLWPLGPGPGAV